MEGFISIKFWIFLVIENCKENIYNVSIQHKSDKNKVNRSQSQIIHTIGSVSMAKYRGDIVINIYF